MRRNTTTRSSRRTNTSLKYDEKLILVRDGVYNYLQFFPVSQKKYIDNPTITAKPVVVIKNAGTQSVLLDYSGANTTNKNTLDLLFNNILPGQTLTFSNAHYIDPVKGIDTNLEAVLSFNSFKNYIVKTETVGATLAIPDGNYYDPVYFIDSPTLTFNTINSINANAKNEINELKNSIPVSKTNNLLKYLGIVPGNYLKIINPNSLNNDTLFRVVETHTDNYEYIKLDPAPQYENLIGESCLVKVFAQCKRPEAIQNIPFNNDWGCAVIQEGVTLDYYQYFTDLQANIKAQEYNNPSLEFVVGQNCDNVVVLTQQTNQITQTNQTTQTTNVSNTVTTIDVAVKRSRFFPVINNGIFNATSYYDSLRAMLILDANKIYEFNQNDPSNISNTLRFSKSPTDLQPLYEKDGVVNDLFGIRNKITLDPVKYVQSNNSTVMYAYSEQSPNYGFTINFVNAGLITNNTVVQFRNAGTM